MVHMWIHTRQWKKDSDLLQRPRELPIVSHRNPPSRGQLRHLPYRLLPLRPLGGLLSSAHTPKKTNGEENVWVLGSGSSFGFWVQVLGSGCGNFPSASLRWKWRGFGYWVLFTSMASGFRCILVLESFWDAFQEGVWGICFRVIFGETMCILQKAPEQFNCYFFCLSCPC